MNAPSPRRSHGVALNPAARAERLARRPAIEYPPELPVSEKREEIARAITANQVVIVCGETGSGKTTQLPKILLEMGRGIDGLIGHTQPRRIAARATAARIAQELKTELGSAVGFKIRFTDRTSRESYIKLMTDGILLAETQTDPLLRQYDTIIIDEAHERSLNIDFLLGHLKQILPKRPDLKVVVTSATLDADRFARHFASADGKLAPVIEVTGRMYPVEVRYRPIAPDDDEADLNSAIVDAVDELARLGTGDALVFLPGEREIREAAEALRKHHPPGTEILPLYARLSAAEQERIFKSHPGRRIVLATNVAETSLTVPGIRYVIDSGLARVKRYSYRNKVEQLQVEKIAQSAAKQRAGRCGRVSAGVCIRLYDEDDFTKRPLYTDPEILRSSLASVILRMKGLDLAEIEAFPFLEAPAPKAIADGYALLSELGAIDDDRTLTEVGRQLAKLPVDPRIGRMILGAKAEGSLPEVLIIAAALSVQDPRDRPMDRAQAADQAQKRFDDERSDFLAYLKLWAFYEETQQQSSKRQAQRICRDHFLNFNRMREWRDIHSQLKELIRELDWKIGEPKADSQQYMRIHRALLTGSLGAIGFKGDESSYLGPRGIKFWIHPGSGLGKKQPRWVVAAEMIETSRLYARCVASIDPLWLESLAGHLIKRSQSDPHWEKKAGEVVALERAVLYGIPIYVNRRVAFGLIDPAEARRVFIRAALVEGDYESRAPFYVHNQRLLGSIEELEHKSRRPDVLVDDELIYAFYDNLIPADVWDVRRFERWRIDAERADPKKLFLRREELMRHEAAGITTDQFPATIELAGRALALTYEHDPGGSRDGVTMTVPLVALNQIPAARCEWLVPGLLKEKVQVLAKSLPPKLRHRLGTLPEFALEFAEDAAPTDLPLTEAIIRYARAERQVVATMDGFRLEAVPAHLFMNFCVVDEHGRQLGMSRNLAQLRAELGQAAARQFAKVVSTATNAALPSSPAAAALMARTPKSPNAKAVALTNVVPMNAVPIAAAALERSATWAFGKLDEIMEIRQGNQTVVGYPALVDEEDAVSLRVFDAIEEARARHRGGLRRLFILALREQVKFLEKNLSGLQQMTLQFAPLGDGAALRRDLITATIERTCMADPLPDDAATFAARLEQSRSRVALIGQEVAKLIGIILAEFFPLAKKLQAIKAHTEAVTDIEAQLSRLIGKVFISTTPYDRLTQLPRYLKAINMRIEKLRADPPRDARGRSEVIPIETLWLREVAARRKAAGGRPGADRELEQFGWLLEELRVATFAQELRTPVPVSAKRLQKMWQTIAR